MKCLPIALSVLFIALLISTAAADDPPVFDSAWGTQGSGNGQLDGPHGIAVNDSGHIFVTEQFNNRVQKFDGSGNYLTKWGTPGSLNGQFSFPYRLAVDSDSWTVYVCDGANARIQKFNGAGSYITQWGSFGSGDGQFNSPYAVGVNDSNHVFVIDSWDRVQKFDDIGSHLQTWGSNGSGNGQFDFAYDLDFDVWGTMWVADRNNERVQAFTAWGTYLYQFSVPGITALGTDFNGHIYAITDSALVAPQIVKYDSNFTVVASWGSFGSGNGQFNNPTDIAIDVNDNVYVVDRGNNRIQKFVPAPPAVDPDLTVSITSATTNPCGKDISASVTVSNIGLGTAAFFEVSLYVTNDTVPSPSDSLIATAVIDTLFDGQGVPLVLAGNYTGPGGTRFLEVRVDEDNTQLETNENNNSDWAVVAFETPVINTVIDVPNDEGGAVYLSWYASPLEPVAAGAQITEYTLWRAISTNPSLVAGNWTEVGAEIEIPRKIGSVVRFAGSSDPYFWELVDTQAAFFLTQYAKTLPTLFNTEYPDSAGYHYFQVIAHTNTPSQFYPSCVDSGNSVDNLAPNQPQNLMANQTGAEELTLMWDANTEPDLSHYMVYRGTTPEFVPGAGNSIGAPTSPELVDTSWQWDGGYYYKVTAIDVNGNESLVAELSPGTVTGVPDGLANRTYLEANHPNPFNPTTTIGFGLKERTFVELAIYDAKGRLVRRLVNEDLSAQHHNVTWDGRNDLGASVASGIYFYRFEAGAFVETRKMVLLK